jgi:hypothetical protein
MEHGVAAAAPGTGLLVMADDYPARRAVIAAGAVEAAHKKSVHLYVEYPDNFPGCTFLQEVEPTLERLIVTDRSFGDRLPPMSIIMASGCHYLPTSATQPLLVSGRVAGYDHAVYGLPDSPAPVLFRTPDGTMIATTNLSGFLSRRYAPVREWSALWQYLLTQLGGKAVPALKVTPVVQPAYGPDDTLPADAEQRSLAAAADWVDSSHLLLSADQQPSIHELLRRGAEDIAMSELSPTPGDGSRGILEGYSSRIQADGSQRVRIPLRADCQAETAMLLAAATDDSSSAAHHRATAANLLDYTYYSHAFTAGDRGDPAKAAYGLIAWGTVAPNWEIGNYGDDNARLILASLAAGSLLNSAKWDESILRAVTANFRTSGRKGFRGDRVDMPELAQKGWKALYNEERVNLSPAFESWLWACYLWTYHQTGFTPFLERTRTGITLMMNAYPAGWRLQDNSERARMLLCLAWLVRVDDTPQHRAWVQQVASDMLKAMQPNGAIAEQVHNGGGGQYRIPATNAEFGTGEGPLIHETGDPVSDQLYTTGFALLALHEAVAVTSDSATLRDAEDRLAGYLCRIQVQSASYPYLSGAWMRAFDYGRWDYWASSSDIGWGPWCVEAGWGQSWTAISFGLRQRHTTLWDLIGSRANSPGLWERVRTTMGLADTN